jgi:hypothetical protein
MRFTFIHEIRVAVFFLPQDHGILRCHVDQHEPFACPLGDDDFLARTFLRNFDMKIVGRAECERTFKKSYAKTHETQQGADSKCEGSTVRRHETEYTRGKTRRKLHKTARALA